MSWIIRLQRLPLSANAADIRAFFAGLRIPDGAVHIVGGAEGDAFIGFATDEDARQAMSYDQRRIHDQRVRLLLSSRVEMDSVIAKARSGELGGGGPPEVAPVSPRAEDAQALLARQIASVSSDFVPRGPLQQSVQGSPDVYGLRNAPHRPGGVPDTGRQADYHQQDYTRGGNLEASWGRTEPQQSESWKSGSQPSYDTRAPASRQPVAISTQHSVTPWQDPKVLNVLSQNGSSQSPASSVPVYQQSGREERYNQYEPEVSFQGYNATVQPPSISAAATSYTQGMPTSSDDTRRLVGQLGANKVVGSVYQPGGLVPPILPGQALPMPPAIPGLVMPPGLASQMPPNPSAVPVSQPPPVLSTQNPYASYASQNAPIFPPMPVRRPEKSENCYVELSRLPTELLRPAALEQFLRPTVPLTLSSVKVVFDPKGFPLHSLVRFENAKDAENVLLRDGEQGIRIRDCTKEMFEAAVDGSVLANVAAYRGPKGGDRERDRGRETVHNARDGFVSRPHYSAERRDSGPRRDDRMVRSDDRNPHRMRRGRSRSPSHDYHESKRRREEVGRFCIEFTNLPFRVTEAEIRQHFGPVCEPTKVTRAYYEDGKPSDRWIVELDTEDLAERIFRFRGKIQDRLLRARRIPSQEADELLAIPDKFGMQRREEYEKKQAGVGEPGMDGMTSHEIPSASGKQNGIVSKHNPPSLLQGFKGQAREDRYNVAPVRESVGLLGGPPSLNSTVPRLSAPSALTRPPLQNGPPLSGPPQRFPGPRTPRANGPLLQGGPRPPLIAPPTFFGSKPSSTIRQRGPPAQPPAVPPPVLNGPRAPILRGGAPSQYGFYNGAARVSNGPVAPPVAKPCIVLANVPDSATDDDLVQFLQIHPSKINDKTRKRMLDGSVYIDLADASEAINAATRCNRQQLGSNCVLVTAITREQMLEGLEKKVAFSEQKEIEPDIIASVGPPGTVISCHGFPADVTLNDVMQFFDKYSLVENSVRIKLDDNGTPTGECLLAVGSPQEASKAVMLLSGRRLNGSTVTMTVVKPPLP